MTLRPLCHVSNMENIRSRNWVMVLYPEDSTHLECINRLESCGYDYACILHDMDTYDDDTLEHKKGDLKKEHFHVVLKLKNPRYREPLAEELGIKPNYLDVCRDFKKALLYLIHEGYPDKYQYETDSVSGTLSAQLNTLLTCDDENERVLQLVNIIDSTPGCTYRDILIKACNAGLWSVFRKLGTGVKYLIDEVNESDMQRLLAKQQCDDFREWLKARRGG